MASIKQSFVPSTNKAGLSKCTLQSIELLPWEKTDDTTGEIKSGEYLKAVFAVAGKKKGSEYNVGVTFFGLGEDNKQFFLGENALTRFLSTLGYAVEAVKTEYDEDGFEYYSNDDNETSIGMEYVVEQCQALRYSNYLASVTRGKRGYLELDIKSLVKTRK